MEPGAAVPYILRMQLGHQDEVRNEREYKLLASDDN